MTPTGAGGQFGVPGGGTTPSTPTAIGGLGGIQRAPRPPPLAMNWRGSRLPVAPPHSICKNHLIWSFRDAVWAEKLFNQPCNFLLPQPIPPLPRCDKNQLILDPIPGGCFWREAGPIYYCDKDLTYWFLHNECCAWNPTALPPLTHIQRRV